MNRHFVLSLVLFFLFLINLTFVSSGTVDSEIQKITNYAEDFETGNINYVQLLIYFSAVREEINAALGATNRETGGALKEEQLRAVLGEPTERTKWVWVEREEREMKLDKEAPAWRKIIFDGKKIQIWLNSWPSMIKKAGENALVYRLNFEINFKEPQKELNIENKISEIKTLAENFNSDSSRENADALAKESVNAEKAFEMHMRQNPGKCEDTMKNIFGTENKRGSQKMLVQEITFYEGENFEAMARIEMCDECEWKWINLNMWLNSRGPGFRMSEQREEFSPEQFQSLDVSEYKKQISEILDEAKSNLEQGNYERVSSLNGKMQALGEAWNQKSNNVWQDVEKMFPRFESMTPEQQSQLGDYWWIRQEQQKREKASEIISKNYQERKEFYLNLFSQYEKKEFSFSQIEYEKRLVEVFKEFGREMCDNNLDDNKNEKIDCSDEQCLGKKCGRQKVSIQRGNETIEEEMDLFCIEGSCELREEIVHEEKNICGNNICEENESEFCKEDCALCPAYDAINCNGNVIFSGQDENKCSLKPICIEEKISCKANEDCVQPLCGRAECVEEKCQVTTLEACREAECSDGDEKKANCNNGEQIIVERCIERIWRETGVNCAAGITPGNITQIQEEIITQIAGNECQIKEDCGGENDVCSNGKCITLPEVIRQPEPEQPPQELIKPPPTEQEPEQPIETQTQEPPTSIEPQETQNQIQQEPQTPEIINPPIAGSVIYSIQKITGKITGFAVSLTGFDVETIEPAAEQPAQELIQPSPQIEQPPLQEQPPPIEQQGEIRNDEERRENFERDKQDREQGDRERREREEKERRENECGNNCDRECKERLISPCVGECVRNSQCKDSSCVDEEIKKCEGSCKEEKGFGQCVEGCQDKCETGERLEIEEQKDEHKEEKGVFKAGGMCRTAQGNQKTEAFIFFDGWGEPFKQIQPLKQKYYSGGNADWCRKEFENLLKQRKEFEQGLNQEFVAWFFEKYLANSADEWEQHVSGIFEIYWRDVDLSRQIAERMNCLDTNEAPQYNLINIKYETDYGKLEMWEEIKTTKIPGIDKEMQIVSPYMKLWVFPSKQFIIYEMQQAMKNHEFPGPPEEKLEREDEEGPTAEEREFIKQDRRFMEQIKRISEKYNGNVDIAARFVDDGKVVFNLYIQVNENDIMKIEPMLPEEVPQEDIRVEIEFQKIYDIISLQEKEMRGERIESPPWDRKTQPVQKIKDAVNGVRMYFKIRDVLSSANVSPEESENDVESLMELFFDMMMNSEREEPEGEMKEDIGEEKGVWEDKEKITGEVVFG